MELSRKKTHEEFVSEVKAVHGENVEVLEDYQGLHTPIKVRYKDCGHEEMKLPIKLLHGHGCIQCRYKRLSSNKTRTTDQYKQDLLDNGVDYIEVLGEYTGVERLIEVRNLRCNHIYSARAGNILTNKSGCPICHGEKDDKSFREIINEKYPDEYTILEEYVNGLTPILIRHNECGYEWKCAPKYLLASRKCPCCMKSKGEVFVEKYLQENNIPYESQFTFDDCKDVNKLPFDFKINSDQGIKLIEFDGAQHFPYERTMYRTNKTIEHDRIKNEYCKANNIPLLRIPYWWLKSSRITKELDKFVCE